MIPQRFFTYREVDLVFVQERVWDVDVVRARELKDLFLRISALSTGS